MDGSQFDRLTKTLSSRRTALGGLLAALLLPLDAAARKKGKQHKRKGKDQQRVRAQDSCWRAGACIPKKGANVSQCDLANYSPSATLDCTGCNISRANLRGANLRGANLTKANLSGSCLVDANLSGATTTNATNLYNAIFCRTVMPNGSINNSGCGSPTACCPTCIAESGKCGPDIGGSCCGGGCVNGVCRSCVPQCTGKACGAADECGSTCDGTCPTCQTCSNAQTCAPQTGEACQTAGGTSGQCCNGTCCPSPCQCLISLNGTFCYAPFEFKFCTSEADCAAIAGTTCRDNFCREIDCRNDPAVCPPGSQCTAGVICKALCTAT